MLCPKCKLEIPDESVFCMHCGKKIVPQKRKRSRANGEGSVYRLPSGKWRASITASISTDESGKFRRKYITKSGFDKKTDALAALEQLRGQKNKPKENHKISLKQVFDKFKASYKDGVSHSTWNCYAAGFKVFSDVWDIPCREQDIDELQECMDTSGKGRKTLENAKTVLGLIFKYAIPRNMAGTNLAVYLKINAEKGAHKSGLNSEELESIHKSIGTVPYAEYVYCHCYLGFRPSEFIALSSESYNKQNKCFIGGSKTEAGKNRTVTVSPKIQPYIDALIKQQAPTVFCNDDQQPLSIKQYREIFYQVLSECKIENETHRLTPHSCRHTFATLMKAVQAPDKDKLELIGHTSTEMLRHYQDVNLDDLRKITDSI